ncbi:MAG TPA: hypothetical protein VFI31_08030, partial [Pirellulales bacterium]|nr:hypothetical protein [Pirellulales bacterium]
ASLRAPAHRASSDGAGDRSPRRSYPTFLALAGMYAATGMALLAKGPIGLLPVIAIGLFSLLSTPLEAAAADDGSTGWLIVARRALQSLVRRLRPRHVWQSIGPLHPLMGLAIVCAVAGPWYVAVGLQTDGAWLAGFFGRHNVGRFLHPLENHHGPIFYYLIAAVVGFFPWSLFLGPIAVLLKSRLADRDAGRARYSLLFCWIGTYLVFFSLAATKLPNYIAPIYPPLALLAGHWLDAWLAGECQVPALLLRTAWTMLGLVGVVVSIALPLVARRLLGEGTILAVVGLPLVAGSGLCFWFSACSQRGRVAVAFAASAVASVLLLFGFGAVEVGRCQTSRTFADAVRRQSPTGLVTVGTFGYWRPSLVFYLGPQVNLMHHIDQARDFCRQWPADRFLITTADGYARLAPSLPSDVSVLVRQRWFLRPDELLLLGRDKSADTRMGALRWPTSNH